MTPPSYFLSNSNCVTPFLALTYGSSVTLGTSVAIAWAASERRVSFGPGTHT